MERSYYFRIRQLAGVERLRRSVWASWRWLTVSFVLSCTACAPIPIHLYVPDAPDGRVVYSHCPMNGHLPDGIEFMREGMLVTVGLGKNHGRDYVDVHLENGIPIVLKDIHFQRRLMILVALINC